MDRLSSKLLAWYRAHKRTFPWRGHPSAYAIWVSEIMLQQTRVEAVIPYFEKWMRLFPDVETLADASEQEVLNAWEGLGYYSRARNLHKAARIVVQQYHGEIPRDLDQLRRLPGIGRYTLGAIASIAFGMDIATLDGNIKRVYARIFDVSQPVDVPEGEKILWQLADEHVPRGHAGDYNQALMDLGALICVPKNPRCLICPVMELCQARQNGTQDRRPVKSPKKSVPHYIHAAGVIIERGRVLLAQRPPEGLLGGMWEFPNGRVEGVPARGLAKALKTGYGIRTSTTSETPQKTAGQANARSPLSAIGIVQHGYSHFSVTTHVFYCQLLTPPKASNLKWVRLKDLDEYPMGKIDRQIARMIIK